MYTVEKGTVITKELVKQVIEYVEKSKKRFNLLENYYIGDHNILDRKKVNSLKNNRVVINHPKYITDISVGYLLGNPVEYQAEDNSAKIDLIKDAYKKQKISKLDNEIATDVSKYGKTYEYTYALEDNTLHSKKIDPRNCIVVYDNTLEHGKEFAIIYSGCAGSGTNKKYKDVLVITKTDIQEYDEELKLEKSDTHAFQVVPVVEYWNNSNTMSDYEDVLTLIDAYNTLMSDRINDKEQLVEAILMLYGFTLEEEQLKNLKDYRVLSSAVDSKAEYLVKQLNESEISILRKEIEADIHKISMTPNLSDENFVGNSSGVAIKYKLLPFEQKTLNKETYFEEGLLQRFEIYNNYLVALSKMIKVEKHEVDVVFKRNLPSNDLETSQIVNNLSGKVSDETLIAQISFVDDAKKEVAEARQQQLKDMQAQTDQFGTNTPNGFNTKTSNKKDNNNSDKTKK